VTIPIGFIAYVDYVRKSVGVNRIGALGAVVALIGDCNRSHLQPPVGRVGTPMTDPAALLISVA
jgi:hypothetical protein